MNPEPSTKDALRWLVRIAFRHDRKLAVLAFLPIAPFCLGAIAVAGRSLINQSIAGNRDAVIVAAITAGVAFIVLFAGSYWQVSTSMLQLREAASIAIDEDVLELTASVPTVDHLDDPGYLDRLEMLRAGKFPLTQTIGLLRDIIFMVTSLIITAVLLVLVDPRLFLLPLSAVPVAWVYYRSQTAVSLTERAVAERRRTALHLFDVGTGFTEAKELRVGRHEGTLQRRFADVSRSIDDDLSRADRRAMVVRTITWLLFAGAVASGLILAIRDPVHAVTPGGVFLTVTVIAQLADQTAWAATMGTTLKNTIDLARHFLWLEGRADHLQMPSTAEPCGMPDRLADGIRLQDVTFAYSDGSTPAVADVTVTLRAGSSVAIVGDNGAGKTTLVKLLCGLYRPSGGTISLDGVPLDGVDPAAWSERVTAVCQDFVRFELTARESVGVGHLPSIDDHQVVTTAVHAARADDLVSQLPSALDTQLGPRFGGVDLSGGQWQRLAVARAMMRNEPLLIAFDEPTVSIDATTERVLVDRLVAESRRLANLTGAVVVYVSHRYSTVRAADEIIVMEHGRIIEHGSHDELMAHDGAYADTYRRQVATYQ
jgi:ABC-type multidrug transport system fused ATPase/permease subunit